MSAASKACQQLVKLCTFWSLELLANTLPHTLIRYRIPELTLSHYLGPWSSWLIRYRIHSYAAAYASAHSHALPHTLIRYRMRFLIRHRERSDRRPCTTAYTHTLPHALPHALQGAIRS
jgi:hypothetical protein